MSVGDNAEIGSSTDVAGNPRIIGHTVDLGAYEYLLPDMDHDGLSDDFEMTYTSPPSPTALHPNSNLDGDSWTALQEFAFGTDPNVPEGSEVAYRTEWSPSNQRLSLFWTQNPDSVHLLRTIPEFSNDLGITDPWSEIAFGPSGVPNEFLATTQTLTPRPEKQFLRLRVFD